MVFNDVSPTFIVPQIDGHSTMLRSSTTWAAAILRIGTASASGQEMILVTETRVVRNTEAQAPGAGRASGDARATNDAQSAQKGERPARISEEVVEI